MHLKTFATKDIKNKNIILRVDYNVPMENAKIADSFRIDETLETIKMLIPHCNKITLISHLGKPKSKDDRFSLRPVAKYLEEKLNIKITFLDNIDDTSSAKVNMLENLRFYSGEEKNDPEFAKKISRHGDIYINDAFSCSHRNHASIEAINHFCKSYAGPLLCRELEQLEKYLTNMQEPVAAVIGGSKISSKIGLIKSMMGKIDMLFIGGAMANSFFYNENIDIGKSFYERDVKEEIKLIKQMAEEHDVELILPVDFVVSSDINNSSCTSLNVGDKIGDNAIFDIGNRTVKLFKEKLQNIKTVFWNGPLGAFEHFTYDQGTKEVAEAITRLTSDGNLVSIIGGGDTLSAIKIFGFQAKFSYVSTGGGALLSYLENKYLPGIVNLLD